jgi:hypothetical protein
MRTAGEARAAGGSGSTLRMPAPPGLRANAGPPSGWHAQAPPQLSQQVGGRAEPCPASPRSPPLGHLLPPRCESPFAALNVQRQDAAWDQHPDEEVGRLAIEDHGGVVAASADGAGQREHTSPRALLGNANEHGAAAQRPGPLGEGKEAGEGVWVERCVGELSDTAASDKSPPRLGLQHGRQWPAERITATNVNVLAQPAGQRSFINLLAPLSRGRRAVSLSSGGELQAGSATLADGSAGQAMAVLGCSVLEGRRSQQVTGSRAALPTADGTRPNTPSPPVHVPKSPEPAYPRSPSLDSRRSADGRSRGALHNGERGWMVSPVAKFGPLQEDGEDEAARNEEAALMTGEGGSPAGSPASILAQALCSPQSFKQRHALLLQRGPPPANHRSRCLMRRSTSQLQGLDTESLRLSAMGGSGAQAERVAGDAARAGLGLIAATNEGYGMRTHFGERASDDAAFRAMARPSEWTSSDARPEEHGVAGRLEERGAAPPPPPPPPQSGPNADIEALPLEVVHDELEEEEYMEVRGWARHECAVVVRVRSKRACVGLQGGQDREDDLRRFNGQRNRQAVNLTVGSAFRVWVQLSQGCASVT